MVKQKLEIGDDVSVLDNDIFGIERRYDGHIIDIRPDAKPRTHYVKISGTVKRFSPFELTLVKKLITRKYKGTNLKLKIGDTVKIGRTGHVGSIYLLTNFGVIVDYGATTSVEPTGDLIFIRRKGK